MAVAEIQDTAAQRASGSSFYTAMRIMPRAQREAMYEIYSFCRKVDDIADSPGPRDRRVEQLKLWRADIDAIYNGSAVTRARGLAGPVKTFGLQARGLPGRDRRHGNGRRRRHPRAGLDKLDAYCDRVASAVGRLSVRVFGMEEKAGIVLAYHLGRALQLTNILRDIDEDAAIGRLYLPREALQAANILTPEPAAVLAHPRLGAGLRAGGRARARAFRRGRPRDEEMRAPERARAAHHVGGLPGDPARARRARLRRRRAGR